MIFQTLYLICRGRGGDGGQKVDRGKKGMGKRVWVVVVAIVEDIPRSLGAMAMAMAMAMGMAIRCGCPMPSCLCPCTCRCSVLLSSDSAMTRTSARASASASAGIGMGVGTETGNTRKAGGMTGGSGRDKIRGSGKGEARDDLRTRAGGADRRRRASRLTNSPVAPAAMSTATARPAATAA